MSEDDIHQVGDTGPIIDSIHIAEFESQAALKDWLSTNAPGVRAVKRQVGARTCYL